jgi:A/G-specific adenine glycosylase
MPPPFPFTRKTAFRAALSRWYRASARRLPWRQAPTLYKTVVSEFMLQQTQVKTVLPCFSRWMAALPDFQALAAAPPARVLKLWEGLGYYSRARNLHRLARALVATPAPPRSVDAWRKFPGVGPYTAAAVASIAFNARAACVDGNVVRILARLRADGASYGGSAEAARACAPLAELLLPPRDAGDHNQAMMELGATVCLRRSPRCDVCPVRTFCAARRLGRQEDFPRFRARRTESRAVTRIFCRRRGFLLLHRASEDSRRLAGLCELPTPAQAGLSEAQARRGPLLARRRRAFTRFQITESIHGAPPPGGRLRPGLAWVAIADIASATLSGPHRRWIAELLKGATQARARPSGPRSVPSRRRHP